MIGIRFYIHAFLILIALAQIMLTPAVIRANETVTPVQIVNRLESDFSANPYDRQIVQHITKLKTEPAAARAAAAEALGMLRAYAAADALEKALSDPALLVRREAAMAIAWCGGRKQIPALLNALTSDEDWMVRQAAWVSLTNLTGMEWPYDALASDDERRSQAEVWEKWWNGVPDDRPPADLIQLASEPDLQGRLRAVRALGILGGKGANGAILDVITPYIDAVYVEVSPLEKNIVICGLRSIGRLQDPQSMQTLLAFLDTVGWARYAAEAFGDYQDARAIKPLIDLYPRVSRNLRDREAEPEICPHDDRFSADNTQDRMFETPYCIAMALSRLPLDNRETKTALQKIAPHLLANLPTSYDSGVFYEIEASQQLTGYLLEKAGMRQTACDIAFEAAKNLDREKTPRITGREKSPKELIQKLSRRIYFDVPDIATWFPAICRSDEVPQLIGLLEHPDGWIRINVAKALMFIGDPRAIEPIAQLLKESRTEMEWGYSGALEHAEFDDPAPRWREAYIRALGRLGAVKHDQQLIVILEDQRNALDMQHAAVLALDELGTPLALQALAKADKDNPFASVRLVAREALWRHDQPQLEKEDTVQFSVSASSESRGPRSLAPHNAPEAVPAEPETIVFIKGDREVRSDFNGQAGVDPWRQTYTITNSGPTMRVGRNLHILQKTGSEVKVKPLTHFEAGFVADCEVSYDGKRIIFSRRLNNESRNYLEVPRREPSLKDTDEPLLGGPDDPWWHIWEINVDGTGLRQLTFGPYHDVMPNYLPDDRIVFSSSRMGLRDEYHGYYSIGLTVMNADGSDIHPIGFNLGADRDPAVMENGRIVFSRLDIFYSRLKTEVTIQTVFPDGTRNEALYGPERRAFWRGVHRQYAAWWMRPCHDGHMDNRNRVLRLSQPQPFGENRILCASSGGLFITDPASRYTETLIPHDRSMAVTSPFPLSEKEILCAASIKQFEIDGKIITCGTDEFMELEKGEQLFRSAVNIDLGLYLMDVETGELTLLYNDPEAAEFEARPIRPRPRPRMLNEDPKTRQDSYTCQLFCYSALTSRHQRVTDRGKLLRVVEGRPVVSRHVTQHNYPAIRWKNHGGTHARVLGTLPLAADGSFFIEVPADRLLQLQVLDSDRRVVGNQTFWMYARPGETRSCIGCHENRDYTHTPNRLATAAELPPVQVLPTGGEFSYRAKAWLKGMLPDEAEERNRTVRADNIVAR